jgi:phage FluMu gp28-like protein
MNLDIILDRYFLPYQTAWINDNSPLKLMQKSRQVGISFADAYHSVRLVSHKDNRLDVYISSRDRFQAKLYIEDCKHWAEILHEVIVDLGEVLLDNNHDASAYVLQFANGKRIYSLSSNPNALAGKRGHVKLDEFALHQDQRLLYRIAKPVTTWGGTLSVISTHRGIGSTFNQLIQDATQNGNKMGWSVHTVPLERAVKQGLVDKINQKTGRSESRKEYLARIKAECIDEEQWLQEYCCVPADESSAFFTYEMINACEDRGLSLMSFDELKKHLALRNSGSQSGSGSPLSTLHSPLFLGMDVARKQNLCVIDVGEKHGDTVLDRCRIELQNKTFTEIETELYKFLALPQLKRASIDATGLGAQLAERAREKFGYKVDPVVFTAPRKEELAFKLRMDFEERKLRIVSDENLRVDLRELKKEVTPSGNIRFTGETEDSHCDRTWAKALRQHAARYRPRCGGGVA